MGTICQGRLTVTGTKEALSAFKYSASDGEVVLSVENFIERPKVEERDWRIENWGCKTGFVDPLIEVEEDCQINYVFKTKQSPITPVIKKMSEQHPSLRFNYIFWELVTFYNGSITFEDGKAIDEYFEYVKIPYWLEKRLDVNWLIAKRVVRKRPRRFFCRWG